MLKLPPPLWALAFVLTAASVSAFLGWPSFAGAHIAPLGIALVLLGTAFPVVAFRLFRREGTEINPTSEINSKLVTSGPYRFTRNPMYVGFVVITLGVAFWTGWTPMFAAPVLVFATANWVHIPFEEAKMRRQFGTAFDDYTAKVRRWL